jgi:hypothetical protein
LFGSDRRGSGSWIAAVWHCASISAWRLLSDVA